MTESRPDLPDFPGDSGLPRQADPSGGSPGRSGPPGDSSLPGYSPGADLPDYPVLPDLPGHSDPSGLSGAADPPEYAASAVLADLRMLAAPPMPADLIARLDAALEAEVATSLSPQTTPDPATTRPARRRWPRLVVAFTTGVMVLAGLSFGATSLWRGQQQETQGDSAAAPETRRDTPSNPASTAEKPSTNGVEGTEGGPRVTHSGTDYTEATLPDLGKGSSLMEVTSDPALERLSSSPSAREDCFTAIIAAHPGRVTLADFGYFKGTPALIVRVTSDGAERFVAVGAECGVSGAHELYTVAA